MPVFDSWWIARTREEEEEEGGKLIKYSRKMGSARTKGST